MNTETSGEDQVTFDDLEGTWYSEHKSDSGNVKVNARFTRRRTHNEELVVCCCGVIAARATIHTEAAPHYQDFLKSIYGYNPVNLPDVIFFDNNCHLQEHLQAQGDAFFKQCILAVDVFHFENKHSQKHEFCEKHCNPASWSELYKKSGEWVFNSSAAEQTNAWIGGYLPITRDMLAHRFEFFIDEMIKRRNETVITRLESQGRAPYLVPFQALDDHSDSQ
ncbi:hypothetical protein H0H92_008013 [Tricholoma furcatifolium]|nr:hypothetical protein H0H92_008013 [Tricholoma furcatifolium]